MWPEVETRMIIEKKRASASYPPHGGMDLVNRTITESELNEILSQSRGKTYTLHESDESIFYRIADGALSPLCGPMSETEFYQVLDQEMIIRNGKKYAWTIPLAFPIAKQDATELDVGDIVAVYSSKEELIGALEISDIYPFDKDTYHTSVYGTKRVDHPGARIFGDDPRCMLLGGQIWALPQPKHPSYGQYMLSPVQTRILIEQRRWERIVGFQTRNALHRAHEYALVYAVETLTREGSFTGAILNPLVGATKSDDVPADIRMKTYKALLQEQEFGLGDLDVDLWNQKGIDFKDNLELIGLDMKMFYAGPKEAIMHAIYRQNYGFTDIVIGRKHADAPFDDGTAIWGDFDAHEKFDQLNGELLIKPVKVGFAAFYKEINRVGLMDAFETKGHTAVFISGKQVRQALQNGEDVDERIMRRCVGDILKLHYSNGNVGIY